MDPTTLKAFMRQISKEKDLDAQVIKDAIERAILQASRKNLSQYRDAVANLNLETGELTVSVTKTVVENEQVPSRKEITIKDAKKLLKAKKLKAGEEVIVPIDPSEFGRIAAQSARQIVMQHIRDAERQKIFNEYKDKVGQVVTGIVQRFEHRDVIMNIGKTEGILPLNEQPIGAKYRFNERLKVMILRVESTPRGPMIVLSRKTPNLVIELFKQEVPEILDGTVQIVGIAREAGVRMKIAVKSTNSDVDPVGACVGMKGSRVQMVVRELENEKIDIVPWSPDPKTFVGNALNPAKIVSIDLDEKTKTAHVIVAQGNLAIAIGRKGQNTKLAAKLTGYRLDIRSENEEELAYEEIQRRYLEDFLSQIGGLSQLGTEGLLRSNYNSVEKIANIEPTKLLPFTGDDAELAEKLVVGAGEYLEALRQMEEDRRKAREEAKAADEAAKSDGESGEAASEEESGEEAEAEPAEEK
ncbi:transcription termination/antitermination protein NusA [Candidatus Sumerlaeota bacterium]|nr:transcription termination/antitermination protein NusA [Candidatus Sumerlaeota bacterium]